MDLLEFARGPALQWAAYILVAGTIWRIVGIVLLKEKPDYSEPRQRGGLGAALKVIYTRSFSAEPFRKGTMYAKMMAYVQHIGFFAVLFLFVPHIVFFEGFLGFDWPGLPNNVIYAISIVTLISLIAALIMRLGNPAQRIISTFDDYASWFVTFLPVLTGIVATTHLGARYETLLALHILSVALLLIYLPFGKLMHFFLVFVTRSQTGAHLNHRGAQ